MEASIVRAAKAALFCAVLLGAGASPRDAEAKWLKFESPQFVVYTEGGEKEARQFIRDLHEYDGLLRMFTGNNMPPSAAKLPIYLVRDNDEIREIQPDLGKTVGGFFRASPLGAIAVSQRESDEANSARSVLLHEYAHYYMMQYYPASYPAWYIEGFAEYFGMTGFRPDTMNVGAASLGRAYGLVTNPWDPIKNILAPAYGEAQSKMFYEESWLFVNYMMADTARRSQLTKYLVALTQGADPEEALRAATGMDFAALDEALKAYLKRGRLPGFAVKRDKTLTVDITMAALPPAADELMFLHARLINKGRASEHVPNAGEVRRRAAKFPNDPFALATVVLAETAAKEYANADVALKTLTEIAPDDINTHYLHALRYFREGLSDPERRDEHWALARPHTMKAFKADPTHYQSLYMYGLTTLLREEEITENTLNALLEAQHLAASVDEFRVEAAIALSRFGRTKEAMTMLAPLVNSPHAADGGFAIRKLIENIGGGRTIDQPMGRFGEPE
ncbi:MAG: hypothetical protein AB7E79_09275 [Rhodospirillaceae bacterium]